MVTTSAPARIERVTFLSNRFGECTCPIGADLKDDHRPDCPMVQDPDKWDWLCGLFGGEEISHIAAVDGVRGILSEVETAWGWLPTAGERLSFEMWRAVQDQPEGCIYDAYSGDKDRPTSDGAFVMVSFVPERHLAPGVVRRREDAMMAFINRYWGGAFEL